MKISIRNERLQVIAHILPTKLKPPGPELPSKAKTASQNSSRKTNFILEKEKEIDRTEGTGSKYDVNPAVNALA